MAWLTPKVVYALSGVGTVALHVVAFGGLHVMKPPKLGSQNVAVMMSSAKKKEKPKPPEPPKPIEAPKDVLERPLAPRRAAAPAPEAPPPPDPVAAAHPQMAAMPDFGISLSGGPGGPGGIAIPMGGGAPTSAQPAARKEKVFGGDAKPAAAAAAEPEGELVKAKPTDHVQPTYTDDARAAGIEGRVRVEISIDETGAVTGVKVLAGLGHGLDESAVAAAKRMHFSPATRGGLPVKSTFVLSMRFVLGE